MRQINLIDVEWIFLTYAQCYRWFVKTGLEPLHVTLDDHVDIELAKVDAVYSIDSIELVGCLDHMRQVLQTASALFLLLDSSVSSIGVAKIHDGEQHGPAAFNRFFGAASSIGLGPSILHILADKVALELRLLRRIRKLGVQGVSLSFIGGRLGQLLFPLFLQLLGVGCGLVL